MNSPGRIKETELRGKNFADGMGMRDITSGRPGRGVSKP